MRAVYRDSQGHTFSAPIIQQGNKWQMQTSDGLVPIAYTFRDDKAGTLIFSHYREDSRAEPDTRLHVEPGTNSFAQLRDTGARATAEYQTQRQQQRQEILDALNQPDARKIAEARAINTQLAQRWSPKRPEPIPPTIPDKAILAEAARFRRKRTEES